jgi:hypothetical protein
MVDNIEGVQCMLVMLLVVQGQHIMGHYIEGQRMSLKERIEERHRKERHN